MVYLSHAQSAEVCKKCCEGLFKTGAGKGSWAFTNTNGRGWSADENSIRYDFENDSRCGGTVNFRQYGTATFTFESAADTTVEFEMEGVAESKYELFDLTVDGSRVVRVQAADNNFCKVSTCNMCTVSMSPQSFTFSGGTPHTILVKADSLDGYYHNNCYFSIKFNVQHGNQCNGCPSCTSTPTAAPVVPTPRPTEYDPCMTRYAGKAKNKRGRNNISAERKACKKDNECSWYPLGDRNRKPGICVKKGLCQNIGKKNACLARKDCFVKRNPLVRGWGACRPLHTVEGEACSALIPDEDKDLCQKSEKCFWSKIKTEKYEKKKCYPVPEITSCDQLEKRRKCVRHDTLSCRWRREDKKSKGVCEDYSITCEEIKRRKSENCKDKAKSEHNITCYDSIVKKGKKVVSGRFCSADPSCKDQTTQGSCEAMENYLGEANCVWGYRLVRDGKSVVKEGCRELPCTPIKSKSVCKKLECRWQRGRGGPSQCVDPVAAVATSG